MWPGEGGAGAGSQPRPPGPAPGSLSAHSTSVAQVSVESFLSAERRPWWRSGWGVGVCVPLWSVDRVWCGGGTVWSWIPLPGNAPAHAPEESSLGPTWVPYIWLQTQSPGHSWPKSDSSEGAMGTARAPEGGACRFARGATTLMGRVECPSLRTDQRRALGPCK